MNELDRLITALERAAADSPGSLAVAAARDKLTTRLWSLCARARRDGAEDGYNKAKREAPTPTTNRG